MTECPVEHQACFPSLEKESVREYASRRADLSLRGEQAFDRMLALLPAHLEQQTASRGSSFPPAFLFSVCDALQWGYADGAAGRPDTSVLLSVLSKLRDWRLLEPNYRYGPGGIYKLALDLALIADDASAQAISDAKPTVSHARLRIKWVGSDSPSESQDRGPASPTPPSPSPSRSSLLSATHECAHVPELNERRSDARYESYCQVGRLETPDSEDAGCAVVSRRLHSVSGFRSGCSACRRPRMPSTSIPLSSQMTSSEQRTPFRDVNQLDTTAVMSVLPPRRPKPGAQHTTPRTTRREKHKPWQSTPRGAPVDENEPPPKSPGVHQTISISFPGQRTHYPRISNTLVSRDPPLPVATPVERRIVPSPLPNRTREGDKPTSSHRTASVDFRLPIASHSSNPRRTSRIDLHPCALTRAQSFSCTSVRAHALGSGGAIQKPPSNAIESRSSRRLPSWSQTHLDCPPTATMMAFVKPTGSSSPSPVQGKRVDAAQSFERSGLETP